MRPALTVLTAVLLAVLPTAIAPAAQAAPAADTLPLAAAVAQLPVAAEARTGYDREQSFGGWIDADRRPALGAACRGRQREGPALRDP
ncbi:hypothetical protein QF034_008216 [Streptomyces africanus]|uniref:Uncharacterized protein n=1 Tax=Streptomyces africanus TaxID=231024 RepID=A0ABU0R3S4_9ACTN|nr:hypothetical protein [Streptomyces africanus]MDQ0753985.1 hypothetical protein [Streptomyces africanus]